MKNKQANLVPLLTELRKSMSGISYEEISTGFSKVTVHNTLSGNSINNAVLQTALDKIESKAKYDLKLCRKAKGFL